MNMLKLLGMVLVVTFVVCATASPAFAQGPGAPGAAVVQPVAPFYGAAIGAGLGAGLTMIGAALGFGRIGSAALESMARQPETAPRVQTAMIVIGALLEGATFFSLVVCILMALRS